MRFACAVLLCAFVLPCAAGQPHVLQPLDPRFEGCGCYLRGEPAANGVAAAFLFQDMDDATTTHVRIDGGDVRLQPTGGELFVEWGSPVGTPVRASFAAPGHAVAFEGQVVRTCYAQASCEAVWYEGVLEATGTGGRRDRIDVSGACGC